MNEGWIKLHRQLLKNDIWRHDKTAWCLFETLLLIVDTKTGSWSGGRFQLSEAYGDINPSTLYKALLRLENAKMVTLSSNTRWTKVSICKWSEYQSNGNTKRSQPSNNQVTTSSQPSNTLTRSKEVRSKNITKVIGEVPEVYGKPEINNMFDKWNEVIGYKIESNIQRNRNACSNLIKKHGTDGVSKLILGVAKSNEDKYAPRISDFISLQSKYNDLIAWGKRISSSEISKVVKI